MIVIKINHLTKRFKDVIAVNDISLAVNEGEIYGFIGQNGAGKSTTIRALLNMIFPDEGEMKILGLDAVKETKEIKKHLSYVPSEVTYYSNMKVKELFNYTSSFYSSNTTSRINYLCEYFELDKERNISELSLGNRKKVSIIQALIKDPKVIILDEPTSGLDPLIQEKLFKILIEEKNKGVTIFLSSHNLSEIEKYCDRVAIIKNGKIIEITSLEKFKSQEKKKVTYTEANNEVTTIYWEDSIPNLLKFLQEKELINLEITHTSIEDEFMKYYEVK